MESTNQPPSTPPVAPAPITQEPKEKSSIGVLIALVIVVLALVGGAAFFLKEKSHRFHSTEASISDIQAQGTSTDPDAIEADLSSESPDTFEADLDAAFGELDASFEAQ